MIGIFDRGYNSGFFNAIGFGLGAHIMARSCRQASSQSQRRHICGRLTGLNPTDLGPVNGLQIGRLSATDAQFVETVFTEGNSIVDHEARGHVSFFVNGGVTQPWCQQTLPGNRAECSHIFALRGKLNFFLLLKIKIIFKTQSGLRAPEQELASFPHFCAIAGLNFLVVFATTMMSATLDVQPHSIAEDLTLYGNFKFFKINFIINIIFQH
jgi:hypothetical protein